MNAKDDARAVSLRDQGKSGSPSMALDFDTPMEHRRNKPRRVPSVSACVPEFNGELAAEG